MPVVLSQAYNRLIHPVFEWFETRDEVFPGRMPSRPPADFWGFIKHYAWPFRYMIAAVAVSGGVTALFEILVYSYLGTLVDWLAKANRDTDDRYVAGHLYSGQQRVHAAHIFGRHGNADDRQRRVRGDDAG